MTLDGAAMTTEAELHAELARGFGFPSFYGANADALLDCLSYLDEPAAGMTTIYPPPGGIVVIELRDAAAMPASVYLVLVDAVALANHRLRAGGGRALIALAAAR